MYTRLFLLTFVTFVVQISLTRLFGYILAQQFTPVCVSIALFGLGTGAFVRLIFCDKVATHRVFAVGFAVMGASLLLVHLSFHVFPHVSGPVLFAVAFFVASGALISKFYEEFKARRAYLAYSLDMAGGALACMVIVPLLDLAGPIVAIVGAGAICFALSAIGWRGANRRGVVVAGTALAIGMLALSAAIHRRIVDEFPGRDRFSHVKQLTERASTEDRARIVDFEWSSVGRADLCEEAGQEVVKWIYYDQMNPSAMLREVREEGLRDFLRSQFAFFPIRMIEPEEMLVIGAGGGFEIELARLGGVERVDAVEINPAIVRLAKRWESFTGSRLERDDVNLAVTDGRTFLNRTDRRYDLIQMSLVLTTSAESNTHEFLENYLYTEESFRTMMSRLTENGCLAIIDDSADRTVRQLVTALSVLQEGGVGHEEAMRRFCVFCNTDPGLTAYRNLLMVFPNGGDQATYQRAMSEAGRLGLQPLWVPGLVVSRPFTDLAEAGISRFLENQAIDLAPVPDDQPFFFDFSKSAERKWKVVWPYLCIALIATSLSVLIRLGRKTRSDDWPTHLTAFLLGVGFIFVELGLIQKLTIAIGSPTKIFSVILFSVLLWCGIGSQLGSRLGGKAGRRIPGFCWAVALVSGIFVYWVRDHYLMERVDGEFLRIVLVILILAPLGLAMGMPFPGLLGSVKPGDDRQLGLIWGVNGLASLAGANLWMVAVFLAGGNATLLCGSGIYVLAGMVAIGVRRT